MKKQDKPATEKTPPLPVDKPKTYQSIRATPKKFLGNRENTDKTSVKSDGDNPQKIREKMEHDTTKRERDPGHK